jgi:hypothetical protein
MIDRPKQIITSDYGTRTIQGVPGKFHSGIDLRNWTDDFKRRLDVILPEPAVFLRAVWEDMWGWTLSFKPEQSGKYEIRFTHLITYGKFEPGKLYPVHTVIGRNGLTPFMKQNILGEHLHFSVWHGPGKDDHEDPKEYFDERGIKWDYSDFLKSKGYKK